MPAASRALSWFRRIALAALAVLAAVQMWFFGWVLYWKWHDPAITSFMHQDLERAAQRAAPGAARPARVQQRTWVDYAHISGELKRAVVVAEDARFVEHEGVDWEALEKAYHDNLRRGRMARGGSTITQQLAKNLFLSAHRSYLRKAQELLIAFMIEATWNKRRILEVYLNVVEWGDGVYGAEAGARHYFGIPAVALDTAQAARMAAMLPSPKFFDRHPDAAYLEQRAQAIAQRVPAARIP